jgi:hypothetical protein
MSRTLTVLALPVTTLSLATVIFSNPTGTESLQSPVTAAHVPQTVVEMRLAEAGAPVAVTKTNWQESANASIIVPISPPGRPKR